MTDAELLELARQARERAYAPYSRFLVGAAVLAEDGRCFTGVNVENASYGLACCAERVAVFKAASEGVRRIAAVAVVADTAGPCSPCGACRQVLYEFGPGARLILGNLKGDLKVTSVAEILPGAFGPADLSG